MITAVGHGAANRYVGQDNNEIFMVGSQDNPNVSGKVVHLLSCYTACRLGQSLVDTGCTAFFGYRDQFIVTLNDSEESRNRLAIDAEIDIGLASGMSAGEVEKKVEDRCKKHVEKLDLDGRFHLASTCEHIFGNLALLGDRNAKLD